MRQIMMLISVLLLRGVVMAGNQISGVVIDNNDASLLVGVAVTLTDEAGKQVGGVTTEANGRFELKDVANGNYVLKCSYVGYEAFTISLKQIDMNVDLGKIRMKSGAVALDEVEITANMVVQKLDRQLVIPSPAQKKAATNGVSLLQYLQLPNISVNSINKSIATNNGETVQLRINGVEVTQAEVMAVRPEDVIRIEYHQQPGMRYGGAKAVLDYIVKRRDSGGSISSDLTNGVNRLGFGNYQLVGKYHQGKSSFTALMDWSRRDLEWNRENEETFHFPTKTVVNSEKVASPNRVKYDYITTSVNYNYTNGKENMLNVALRSNIKDIPYSFTDRNSILYQEDRIYEVKDREQSKTCIPSLDIYYQLNLKNNRHLYFDVVGTYLKSNNERTYSMTEQGVPQVETYSKTEGDKYSIIGEAIYEQPLWNGKFTAGVKHNHATMDNVYQSDVNSKVLMNTAETSLFTEFQSKLGQLNYIFGLGVMRIYYKQGCLTQEKYFFRPSLNVFYNLGKVYLRYNAQMSGYAPSLSALSDVAQPMDAYQVRKGNPGLKSVNYFTNHLSVSSRMKCLNLELSARYSYDKKPIMEEVIYENGMFVRTFDNQKGFHRLNLQANIQIKPYKQYISISLNPFFNRYISQGNKYTHTHSNFGFRGSVVGMYKNWVVMADMKTSYHELFGETIKQGEAIHTIAIGYNKQKWAVQMMAMNPFTRDYHQEVKNVSAVAPSKQLAFSRDLSPMFMLNVSFNLSFGKQKKTQKQRIENADTDTGILSGTK